MAEIGNLTNPSKEIITSNDNIVIKKYIDGYEGGRTLDTTGYTPAVIKAGHLVIVDTATKKIFKPMPITEEVVETVPTGNIIYAALPGGYKYAGIVAATKTTDRPFVGILTQGTVNPAAAPYPMDTILSAVKTALPLIEFRED